MQIFLFNCYFLSGMPIDYKKLDIWHLSYNFTLKVYRLLDMLPASEKDNISQQLKRASTSIPIVIAEGSARRSIKEFRNFVNMAFGSAKEVDVLLMLCKDLKYIDDDTYDTYHEDIDKLLRKIFLYMKFLDEKVNQKYAVFNKD